MAIFAVMHIFAFPWKPYSRKHFANPIEAPGTGYSGGDPAAMKYMGGPLGIWALADAFNPWDIIKMTARGLRWLFVGARKRHNDPSYQNPTKAGLDGTTGYSGPTFAGSGGPATELQNGGKFDSSRGRSAEDDRAGLLGQSGNMGRMPSASPYRTDGGTAYGQVNSNDSQMDLGQSRGAARIPPAGTTMSTSYKDYDMKSSDFNGAASYEDDAHYNPGYGPATSAPTAAYAGAGAQGLHGGVHPMFRTTSAEQTYGAPSAVDDRPPPGYWPQERR